MDKLLICLILSLVLFTIGCSSEPKVVELTRDNFSKLNPSKVKEVCITSSGKTIFYSYDFSITNPEKIKTIIECIQNANQIEDYYRQVLWPHFPEYIKAPNQNEYTLRQSRRHIQFKTSKARYETLIAWDDKLVYGLWWQSHELSKNFKKWNLFEDISKADPNWLAPGWIKNPPSEGAPYDPNIINLDPNYIPFH